MKRKIILGIFILSIFGLLISFIQIISWNKDSYQIESQLNIIKENVNMQSIKDNQNTQIITNAMIDKEDPYWDYIKINLINVDFRALKKINTEVKGWIQVNGTNINYPFVQSNNNDFYLTHSFDKSKNRAGWVFLDYRNNLLAENKNIILYAHRRFDKTMFGTLKNILTSNWLENKENHIVKLSTENENTLWQIFSIYHIPITNDYLQVNFESQENFFDFLTLLKNRSTYNFNTIVDGNDQILTLSTCYDNQQRLVLHAKLIKKERK